ncbi:MAG TPA: ParB/RepB/Spo0J family partition protein [Polaromonas sp.]|uniref:ParB/RepB/Spo0J family partition protein n=1 Tax=Polaromonas sp. TaxID=1869339 RepID=UPI002D24A184|nr:ParB/RepB/Spo0J family partition protein [Polaromonas sp.]HYW57709.1 ParB/RepB/Spo0J family partition protein [Polaromonas sp.]
MSKATPATTLDAPVGDQISYAVRALFVPSLSNRKNFNQLKLTALAETIKAFGIQSPLIVRKLPGERLADTRLNTPKGQPLPIYEIVAGERRWLAAGIAGLEKVPFILRDLTDAEALDIQLIENLAREDLTPLEEGEAFAHRIEHGGLTAEQVGAKVGRSREYVYSKTKLLDLCTEAKDALRDDKIDASHALRIARIPDPKLQLKALEYATTPRYGTDSNVPSVTEFQRWLRQNVMLMLNAASFKITDASLVKDAGSCKDCMKRTGANPDIFSDVDGADICTDPPCFNTKTDAHRANLVARAEKEGMRVIDGAEAKKICNMHNSTLRGYSPMSQQRLDATDSGAQLGKLLGKDAPAPVLIENPYTRELIKAVPTDEAEAVLLAKGLIKVTKAAASKKEELDHEIEYLKSNLKRNAEKQARQDIYAALLQAIRSTPADKAAALLSPALLRAWLIDMLYDIDHDEIADILGVEVDSENYATTSQEAATLRLQACDDGTVYRAAATYMLQQDRHLPHGSGPHPHPIFDALASRTHTDLQRLRKDAEQAVKDETADKIRELKAQHKAAQKPPSPTGPLAQPTSSPPAAAAPADGAKPKLKKGKLSGEEAQSGIAAAMQDMGNGADSASGLVPQSAWPFPGTFAQDRDAGQSLDTANEPTFTVGQRVTVTSNLDALRGMMARFAGKGAMVTEVDGDDITVKIDGRNGVNAGTRMFDRSELVAA